MSQHVFRVEEAPNDRHAGTVVETAHRCYAKCSKKCRWKGKNQPYRFLAMADLLDHYRRCRTLVEELQTGREPAHSF